MHWSLYYAHSVCLFMWLTRFVCLTVCVAPLRQVRFKEVLENVSLNQKPDLQATIDDYEEVSNKLRLQIAAPLI